MDGKTMPNAGLNEGDIFPTQQSISPDDEKIDQGNEVPGVIAAALIPNVVTAAVNTRGWSKLPIADRDTKFAFRAAVDRLAAHANSIEQFSSWFFWRDQAKPANNRNSYRMPFADVFDDGTVKLVPAAVFSAAAQLSGAHGLLSIPEADRQQIMRTIDRIYDQFRTMWDDPRQIPPWERTSDSAADEPVKAAIGEEDEMPIELVDDELVAAAAPIKPPAAWYANPMLDAPTKLRITDDGRVYGHLAQWNSCHRGASSCVLAPHSITNYAHFKTGTTLTAEGMLLPVGVLTYGGQHADTAAEALAAQLHYADAGKAIANVNVGEDAYGIWVAGAMAPGTGDLEAQQLRQAPLSGDWRRTGGNLELIAALAVNTPGFPINEPQYSVTAGGDQISLTAAGIVFEDVVVAATETETVDTETDAVKQRVASLEVQARELQERINRRRARTIIDINLPKGT